MKSRFKIVALALVVGVLFTGALALAEDFVWGCPGPVCAPASWTEQSSWTPTGYPQNTIDNATLNDPDPYSTCTYDPSTALTINEMTLAGVSPTKMTLHVRDQTLNVDEFNFEDYGEINADKDFTADGPSSFSGDLWVDVADSTTVTIDVITVVGAAATLHLTTGTNSICDSNDLTINSVLFQMPTSNRTFKLLGNVAATGGDLSVTRDLILKSNTGVGASEWAKLWVASGTMTVEAILDIEGGDSQTSAARIDVDGTLTSNTRTEMDGLVTADVASGKTFDTGKLEVHTGAILTKTGTGTLQSS